MLILCILKWKKKKKEKEPPLKFSFIKSRIFLSYYVLCTLILFIINQYFQPEHGFKLVEAMLKKQTNKINRENVTATVSANIVKWLLHYILLKWEFDTYWPTDPIYLLYV